MDERYFSDEPIFALATPFSVSAIAVFRLSGKGSLNLLSAFCTADLTTLANGKLVHCYLKDRDGGTVDEVTTAVFTDGHGYTGEEACEIYCHGSLAVIKAVTALLISAGFRQAAPGEFTFRAVKNGKMDLTRAEAVNELVNSTAAVAREGALNRLSGALEKKIEEFRRKLLDIYSRFEVRLDYSDDEIGEDFVFPAEEIEEVKRNVIELLSTYKAGRIASEGVRIALIGEANAGKSTLFNCLLRSERAMVSPVPGTTRDYIEASVELCGIPVTLFDTAGFNAASADALEMEGIRRTGQVMDSADLIVHLYCPGCRWKTDTHGEIAVWNKVDLCPAPEGFVPISAKNGVGIDLLLDEIKRRIEDGISVSTGGLMIESEGQKASLEKILSHLNAVRQEDGIEEQSFELFAAIEELGRMTGAVDCEEILDRIFSNFCVGK